MKTPKQDPPKTKKQGKAIPANLAASTPLQPKVEFTVAKMLREIRSRAFQDDAGAMFKAILALGAHEYKLTRERLAAICEPQSPGLQLEVRTRIHWSDLHILDHFIRTHGGAGIANLPLLTSASFADTLLCSGLRQVHIHLGSRLDTGRYNTTNIRAWDMLSALSFLKRTALHGNIRCDLPQTVIRSNEVVDNGVKLSPMEVAELEKTVKAKLDQPGIHISIGAPYANPVTEIMLSRMQKFPPFSPQRFLDRPFYFLWNRKVFNPYESTYSIRSENLPDPRLNSAPVVAAASEDRARALIYSSGRDAAAHRRAARRAWHIHPKDSGGGDLKDQTEFGGVLCVQPRINLEGEVNRYWVAVIGMTGAATQAIAEYCCTDSHLGVQLACLMIPGCAYWLPFGISGGGALLDPASGGKGALATPLLNGNFQEFPKSH